MNFHYSGYLTAVSLPMPFGMCEEIKTLESNDRFCIDVLLHGHIMAHIIFDIKTNPSPTVLLQIGRLSNNQNASVKVFVDSRRVEFAYELVVAYILGCIGIEEYDCRVHLLEDVDDLCILKNLIYAIDKRFGSSLEIFSHDGKVQIALSGMTIYETNAA